MHPDFLDTLAHVHDLPMPAVQRVAATVAERCALIANRYESGAIAQADQPGPVGAHIGAAILAAFELDAIEGTTMKVALSVLADHGAQS